MAQRVGRDINRHACATVRMALEASAAAIKALNLHATGVLKALHAALDATRLPQSLEALSHHTAQVLRLLALLVQKYEY